MFSLTFLGSYSPIVYNLILLLRGNSFLRRVLSRPFNLVLSVLTQQLDIKLLGVDVGSIGDAHGNTEGAKNYTFIDEHYEIYKKIVVSEDGETWTETPGLHRWRPSAGDALSAVAVSDQGRRARSATVKAAYR